MTLYIQKDFDCLSLNSSLVLLNDAMISDNWIAPGLSLPRYVCEKGAGADCCQSRQFLCFFFFQIIMPGADSGSKAQQCWNY